MELLFLPSSLRSEGVLTCYPRGLETLFDGLGVVEPKEGANKGVLVSYRAYRAQQGSCGRQMGNLCDSTAALVHITSVLAGIR